MEMPARGDAAFRATIRFASAPTIRCRSAHLVEVQTNLLLATMHTVSIMRTAASEAMPLRQAIPGLIESEVERSYVRVMNRRQSDSEDRSKSNRLAPKKQQAPDSTSTAALQASILQCRGQGAEPLAFSWGSKGAILSRERMAPLSVQRHRRCLSLPRRARETPSPVGQIKKVQLFLKNPLDKWAPRAIMQPTSEELQTYDGEK